MTDRKAELKARIAADQAELARLEKQEDYERFRPMLNAFYRRCSPRTSPPFGEYEHRSIERINAAIHHHPDVIALVQVARGMRDLIAWTDNGDEIVRKALAPFAAIKGE